MKIAATIIGAIVLVACAGGLIMTYSSLAATQDTLKETQNTLENTQSQLQDTTESLDQTRTELEETASSLEVTKTELTDQKAQTENYMQMYESSREEIDELQTEYDSVNEKYRSLQRTNDDLQESVDDLQDQLDLYIETLGTQVFSHTNPPYRSGNVNLFLINNPSAENPTWRELQDFLKEDRTDQNLYIDGVYECGNYAEELHNIAEAAGIRAAFVAIHFYEGPSHAINAFLTTDRGLVYVDDTGGTEEDIHINHRDKLVELAKDEPYEDEFLFPDIWVTVEDDSIVKNIEIYW